MDILKQIKDKTLYTLHSVTYDPEAEEYVKRQEAAKKAAEDAAKQAAIRKEKQAADAATSQAKAKAVEEQKIAEEKRENFNTTEMTKEALKITGIVLLVFVIIIIGVFGASLATNLMVYKSTPYRIFSAIYGFIFCFIVIPYVLGYRWWWKGKKPIFYALIPIIPYHLDNKFAQVLFSWLSYKPDDTINALKEWR
jgi:Fe2+ transport system protein B